MASNQFIARKGIISLDDAQITGSLSVTGNISASIFSGSFVGDGSQLTGVAGAATASYIEYANVANKPALVSGSSQISFNGIVDKPTLVSGSSQVTYSGISGIPAGIVSGSSQVSFNGIVDKPTLVSGSSQVTYGELSGIPVGIVSSSAQITGYNIFATTGSNQFNGSQAITGSLTVTGQVVAQTLNVQQVTSSIVFSSGSNVFGSSLSNTQQLTGSVSVTGSLTVNNTPAILGSLTSGQVAFGTAANTVGGDSGLIWDNTNKRLGIGTTTPASILEVSQLLSPIFRISSNAVTIPNLTDIGTIEFYSNDASISARGVKSFVKSIAEAMGANQGSASLVFGTSANNEVNSTERWRITSTGILQSNGAQTIQTSTGNLTLATGGGNGNILLTPNGTGNVGIGTASPDTLLHLSSTTDTSILRLERNSVTITSGQSYGQVQWEGQDASNGAAGVRASIDVISEGNLGETKMVLRTSGANFNANLDRLTINSAGDLVASSNIYSGGSTGIVTSTGVLAQSEVIQIFNEGAALTNIDKIADLILANNMSFTDGTIGRIIGVNNNLTSADKRVAQIAFGLDGATNSGAIGFATMSAGTFATRLTIASTGAACFACELTAKSLGTNDLILNNLNHEHANYVDGTRGSWLIQEGACDLFIINQVSCKKYKFNLIEIN